METLSAFPQLTTSEFEEACNKLDLRYGQRGLYQVDWQSVDMIYRYKTEPYLQITKSLPTSAVGGNTNVKKNSTADEDEGDFEELEDDDDGVLDINGEPKAFVFYDIILSPVYRVPVLYISMDPLHRYPPTMQTLYEHLVPPDFKAQTENGGVVVGVSIQDHPATNHPVFFIHPCQTADVMEASIGKRNVTAEEYLILWIGALGKCVGLNVPLALMQSNEA